MMMKIEKTILKNLLRNEEYARRVLPFLKEEYFVHDDDKLLFKEVTDFFLKYNRPPTQDALLVELDAYKSSNEMLVKGSLAALDIIYKDIAVTDQDWLIKTTETFCQEQAVRNAIITSMDVLTDKNQTLGKGSIPKLLSDALAITFDPNVGHDYLAQHEDRFEYYHRVQQKIPFDIDLMNKITKNGVPRKTLNVIMAGTGVGKSLFMCHHAAHCLSLGKNVLYITLELAEEEVAKRIDANLLNLSFEDLMDLPKATYDRKVQALKSKTNGQLIIKEYPTAGASVSHFKALLNELFLKKTFRPDVIFIDYLNICMSARLKQGNNTNSYTYVKAIAEEMRGLAVEANVPIFTATQTNRAGFVSSDVGLENTSESFGLPATADFMIALIATEELDDVGQIMVKQLKNRYNDLNFHKRFVVGIDRSKMKLYDLETSAQNNIADAGVTQNAFDQNLLKTEKERDRAKEKLKGLIKTS
jgi:replicative DNA helicase